MVDQLGSFASEVTRVAREVGTEGQAGRPGQGEGRGGHVEGPHRLGELDGGQPHRPGEEHRGGDHRGGDGDLSRKITVDVKGEVLELKNTINTMVDQLRSFRIGSDARRARVGTEGKLGGQAVVEGVSGTWKDLHRLGELHGLEPHGPGEEHRGRDDGRGARETCRARSRWDVKGEVLELKNTVNTMVDQLSSFAAEVTRVAREVGHRRASSAAGEVKGVSGTWKDLTESVNSMAGNLTGQVRNIAEVTTGGGDRRPLQEDHGGREGRGARAQEHHQHDGGPAAVRSHRK
jgi:HAMP domain-containing protein